jgi:hypothetical protein
LGHKNYFDLIKYVELPLNAGKKLPSGDRYWQLLGRSGSSMFKCIIQLHYTGKSSGSKGN